MRRIVRTADGRTLAVEDQGDPAGRAVLVHHGTPSCGRAAGYQPWARDAVARGLRLISYDRPGYGQSSPHPGRIVADAAADVRRICADLAVDRILTWGFSGGGPHALACAALLPDLVTAAAALACLAPFEAAGLDWFAGMHRDGVEDTRLHLSNPDAARKRRDEEREDYLSAPDGQDGYYGFLLSCAKTGLLPGAGGWWDDNSTQLLPWGFDVAAIAVPVLLLHGGRDIQVPIAHGEWLAGRIPGAETRWFPGDGHAALARDRVPEAHEWLSARS